MAAPIYGHETEESDPESHGCHLPFAINYVIQYIFSRCENFNVIRKSLPELRRNCISVVYFTYIFRRDGFTGLVDVLLKRTAKRYFVNCSVYCSE